jgi:hypothetical protein
MTAHKRIQITIQTDQILLIRRRGCARLWCPDCGRDVEVVDLAQAEALTGMTQPSLGDCSEPKKWHCLKSPDGTHLICLESLLKAM